jgi:two-component system sensor histidine kinase KdpD
LEQHAVTTDIDPEVPLVYLDYVGIAQVLTNLVENAAKYTPPGTPIRIRARIATPAAGPVVEVSVEDGGPGIPAEQRTRVFDKFYRVDSGSRTPGTGIGLAISKGFVEAHGGRIWVEDAAGGGAAFRFTLPLPAPALAADEAGVAP